MATLEGSTQWRPKVTVLRLRPERVLGGLTRAAVDPGSGLSRLKDSKTGGTMLNGESEARSVMVTRFSGLVKRYKKTKHVQGYSKGSHHSRAHSRASQDTLIRPHWVAAYTRYYK